MFQKQVFIYFTKKFLYQTSIKKLHHTQFIFFVTSCKTSVLQNPIINFFLFFNENGNIFVNKEKVFTPKAFRRLSTQGWLNKWFLLLQCWLLSSTFLKITLGWWKQQEKSKASIITTLGEEKSMFWVIHLPSSRYWLWTTGQWRLRNEHISYLFKGVFMTLDSRGPGCWERERD